MTFRIFFTILPFSEKFLEFDPMTFFLVIDRKFRISPHIFALSLHFPLFPENFSFPPYFSKFPPVLGKFNCFLHTLRVLFPPYFDHDAFMHHPMHVLDAPAGNYNYRATTEKGSN